VTDKIVKKSCIYLTVNQSTNADSSTDDIYVAARDSWSVADDVRDRAEYAIALRHNVVIAVYRIDDWLLLMESPRRLWQFIGTPSKEKWARELLGRDLSAYPVTQQNGYRKHLDGLAA
jgi:hypothetical protein